MTAADGPVSGRQVTTGAGEPACGARRGERNGRSVPMGRPRPDRPGPRAAAVSTVTPALYRPREHENAPRSASPQIRGHSTGWSLGESNP